MILYIATDNLDTQNKFYELYNNRIKTIKFIEPSINVRQTSIKDCIIDLYICIDAEYFLGSNNSSFTDFINHLRNAKNNYDLTL